MKAIKLKNKTARQAKAITERSLGKNILRILLKDKVPSLTEEHIIRDLKNHYKNKLFNKIIFDLTHIDIRDSSRAKRICRKISIHKKHLDNVLNRDVGIEIAALDYIKNIENLNRDFSIIEKSKIEDIAREAIIDDKTDIFSSSLLYSDLNKEIERTKRYGGIFSIIFIDIDEFKKVNDNFGHLAGDKLLIQVSNLIENNIRSADAVYRYGGDEFLIILPETSSKEAFKIALKIKDILNSKNCFLSIHDVSITLSMGISSFGENNIDNFDMLLRSADKALYKAKKSGRNKICVFNG